MQKIIHADDIQTNDTKGTIPNPMTRMNCNPGKIKGVTKSDTDKMILHAYINSSQVFV